MEITLKQTCKCCPEQYDAYIGERQVAYIRVRWGQVTVKCPDVKGEVVYQSRIYGDGYFSCEHEREMHLTMAKMAIARWDASRQILAIVKALDYASDLYYEGVHTIEGFNIECTDELDNLIEAIDKFVDKHSR